MRKFASLLATLMLFSALAFGQVRTVTGTVRDPQGNPIPFATITVSGTKNAVQADANGVFSIQADPSASLVITATGYRPLTVSSAANLSTLSLTRTEDNLQEVVVTALGVRRKPEEIGYATTTVRPEQITAGRNFNVAQALSGKVSGLNVSNTSASVNATPRIVLRGLRSLTGDNQALVVLDGVQVPRSTINFINPNDVERIDILKGGQAATLFGSEGVNGAIMITTKKGSQKPEVTLMHTNNIEKVTFLPKFQDRFGSGSAYGANQQENFHPAENQQFGDRYDGSIRPVGRQLADGSILLLPYAHNPNARSGLWNTGNTGQTDFSYRSGDQTNSFFASYQNLYSSGVVFGDKYNRNSIRLNSSRTYGKVSLGFDANYVWDRADRTNTDFYFLALNSASWIPTELFKDWRNNKFGEMSNYFNDYYNNPWWSKDNQRFETRNNVLNANIRLNFKPIQALELTARFAMTSNNGTTTTTGNPYSFTQFSAGLGGAAQPGAFVNYFNNNYDRLLTGRGRFIARTNLVGSIGESAVSSQRYTGDIFGTYRKTFNDFSLTAIVGMQGIVTNSKSNSVSTTGIAIPDLFNFDYSATGLFNGGNGRAETRKIGGFTDVTLGYKSFLYFHGSYRRDYTSVFSDEAAGFANPAFSTFGGDVSFILTDAVPSIKNNIIDNVKIRASYNQNGNDNLGAYSLRRIYPLAAGFPYSGLVGSVVGSTLISNTLEPERVRSTEVGLEMGFWKNRITVEASYYMQKSDLQILNIQTSSATGGTGYLLNAADVENKGFDLDARVNIVRNRDWNITVNGNYSNNKNRVLNLYGETGLSSFPYQSTTNFNLNAQVGQMFPYLTTTAFLRDPATGKVVVSSDDGWPERAEQKAGQGTTTPIHIVGTGVNVSWRNFTFQANAEYRGGHVVYHDLGEDMTFTGTGAVTALYERETFIWPNSVIEDPANPGKYIPNTNVGVGAYQAMYQGYGDQGFTRGLAGVGETYVSSAAFWKMRDMSLSYDFGQRVLNKLRFIKGISITAFARNPFIWLPSDNWYTDPEFSNTNGNAQGVNTSLNTPPVRQFGGVIKVVF